ncbi:MAG: glycosyltransferase [Chloroflexota bacterium]
MRELVKEFVEIVSKTLPIIEPIFEFGALQVEGQENFANLRPFFAGKQYFGCDMREGSGVDLVLNCHKIDLASESAGTVMALDTLEHVEFTREAMDEFVRILKPEGLLVISSVMNFPIHDHPYDYWRFTPHAFKSLLKDFPYFFVDSVGDETFPHTVIGIACKGTLPDDSVESFMKEFSQWKRWWDSAQSWEESTGVHVYYNYPRPEVVQLVPQTARRVLDVGCAAGAMGKALKERGVETVVGVEINAEVAEVAATRLDQVIVGDIDNIELPFDDGYFDCIVLADVLEHMRDPWSVVGKLVPLLAEDGCLVCSVPNIRNLDLIHSLVQGNWTYTSSGLLDRTHLRFFTFREFRKLLLDGGLSVTELVYAKDPRLPFSRNEASGDSKVSLNYGAMTISDLSPTALDELTTYQFLVVAAKTASAQRVAKETDDTERKDSSLEQPNPLVSMVILTHNQLDYTRLCVESIQKHTQVPYELIFVDNGSQDGTLDYLRAIPGAKVIANEANLGFAMGCNQGMAAASGDYIMLLNNDVVVTDDWLKRMVHVAETIPEVGLVGPMSNYVSGVQLVSQVPYESDLEKMQSFARLFSGQNTGKGLFVHRAIGFCLLIKRDVVERIGGLDPLFGTGNFEDDDFCLRAQLAGYRIWIAKDVFIHHFGSRTFAGAKIDYSKCMLDNWAKFKAKWGLPKEADIRNGYRPDALIGDVFDAARHYVPLQPQQEDTQQLVLQQALREAQESEVKSDLGSALAKVETALSLAPDNPVLLLEAGRLCLCAADEARARGFLERSVSLDDSADLAHAYLGLAYLGSGEAYKAEESLTRALDLNPSLRPARRGLADALLMQGKSPEATRLLQEIVAGQDATADDLVALADCYHRAGARESAKIGYEAVLGMIPDHAGACAGLAALSGVLKGDQDGQVKVEAKER